MVRGGGKCRKVDDTRALPATETLNNNTQSTIFNPTAPWSCANGAAFNLSNPLLPQRPLGWTSADAAGLPIYPGLIKVEEIKAGVINHAIRFTARRIRDSYQYPASHLITGRECFSCSLLLHHCC